MTTVGIIANPASGKDIRRLVAHGSVFDNEEKANIVRRLLLGLDAVGVTRVLIMPERFGIGLRALDGIQLNLETALLDVQPRHNQEDSRRAAQMMVDQGVRCLITLGGDGTNRIVAKASGDVPIMPISTGTNNVFPVMIEGTIAGLAAGLVAVGAAEEAVFRAPRIDVWQEGNAAVRDMALVDAVVYAEQFIASRAIWDEAKIRDVILTRAEPGNIGLSSVGSHLLAGDYPPQHGLYLRIAPEGRKVLAPIAPGLLRPVAVAEHRLLPPGDDLVLTHRESCVLALDGEREVEMRPGTITHLCINPNGPRVVDARKAIAVAARAGKCIL